MWTNDFFVHFVCPLCLQPSPVTFAVGRSAQRELTLYEECVIQILSFRKTSITEHTAEVSNLSLVQNVDVT